MNKQKSTEELAQQIERESEDPELWSQDAAQIEARPSRTSVLSLRLPASEFRTLLADARRAGESISEYVRKAIAMRREFQQNSPTINVSYTHVGMHSEVEPTRWDTWSAGSEAKANIDSRPLVQQT
jgi:hypothetical protein